MDTPFQEYGHASVWDGIEKNVYCPENKRGNLFTWIWLAIEV